MRVLLVSQYFWPEDFRINDVVAGLLARGIQVDVLTGKPNYPEGKIAIGYRMWGCQHESWNGAQVFRVPLYPRGRGGALRLAANYLSFVLLGSVLGPWLLRRRSYDVIFVYVPSPILSAIPAVVMAWIKRCPMILWVQDLWPESLEATGYVKSRWILQAVGRMVHWIYRQTDFLLVQSRAFIAPVMRMAPGKHVMYYPNSVDSMFARTSDSSVALPSVPALDAGFSVLFAGNVGAAQDVDVIVDAAELLTGHTDIQFVVLGHGSRWEWMREQLGARGLGNVHLAGRFPVNTMPGLMQKADVLLVTLADKPIFAQTVPNKVQAYLASGRPIIACLNGEGARLVQEAGAGKAVAAGDAVGLAEAVLHVYRMTEAERAALGVNARRYYLEHFDHNRLVDVLVEHFKSVIQRQGERV
jgi:glycosyltransferase involved in cell wall biosynthesis